VADANVVAEMCVPEMSFYFVETMLRGEYLRRSFE
jgi:hypothetical protein